MYFPAKREGWLGLIALAGFIVICSVLVVLSIWPGILLVTLLALLLGWLWFGTGYKVTETLLIMVYGPFRKRITLETVIKVNNLGSNKLEVLYGDYKRVYVKPKDKKGFVELMEKSCPLLGLKLHKH